MNGLYFSEAIAFISSISTWLQTDFLKQNQTYCVNITTTIFIFFLFLNDFYTFPWVSNQSYSIIKSLSAMLFSYNPSHFQYCQVISPEL